MFNPIKSYLSFIANNDGKTYFIGFALGLLSLVAIPFLIDSGFIEIFPFPAAVYLVLLILVTVLNILGIAHMVFDSPAKPVCFIHGLTLLVIIAAILCFFGYPSTYPTVLNFFGGIIVYCIAMPLILRHSSFSFY